MTSFVSVISTLRDAVEAMGGTLDIIARFPDGSVKIANFSSIDIDKDETVVCDSMK